MSPLRCRISYVEKGGIEPTDIVAQSDRYFLLNYPSKDQPVPTSGQYQLTGKLIWSQDDHQRTQPFSTENDHYQIVNMGWDGHRRLYGCTIHIDIKDGKIWIQHNMTEIDLAEELGKLGVPKEDIVLGFHSPFMRQFTDYAVS